MLSIAMDVGIGIVSSGTSSIAVYGDGSGIIVNDLASFIADISYSHPNQSMKLGADAKYLGTVSYEGSSVLVGGKKIDEAKEEDYMRFLDILRFLRLQAVVWS